MHPLTKTFEAGRALLAANPSVAALADPVISLSSKLTVVPMAGLKFALREAFDRQQPGDPAAA